MEITVQDCTIIAAQIVIFLVLWAVLRRLWFQPVALVLRERTARSEGAVAEAEAVRSEADRLRAEHARAIDEARTAAQRDVQEILRAAEAEQKRIVAEAHADAELHGRRSARRPPPSRSRSPPRSLAGRCDMTEHGAGHHAPGLETLLFPLANFVVFALMLFFLLRGPLAEYFRDRAQTLRDALDSGAAARREAEALRAQLELDLADLPRLRKEMADEFVSTAERQRERLIATANETAARLRRDAELVASQEEVGAREALRAELIEAAVGAATDIVRAAISPDDQRRYVREFVDEARGL
jgi:F-type H+-transporting ATPase subunit b